MIGATGLIGRTLAPLLVADGHAVTLLTRRPAGVPGANEMVAPGEEWPGLLDDIEPDVAISTLGTTWRKAGSWAAFEAVDRAAVVAFARAARQAGARQMIAVSSVGADARARNAYLALKGRVEADLCALDFDRLDLVRPGLLRGVRPDERRPAEAFGILVSPLLNLVLRGPLSRYAAIDAERVARAIARLAGAGEKGRFVHENAALRRLA